MPDFPWMNEPDEEYFTALGLKCLVVRDPELLHLCGYVCLPPGDVLYGVDHKDDSMDSISVHGGLTFSGETSVYGAGWWIGFDAAHCHDLVPGILLALPPFLRENRRHEIYRDFEYMRAETRNLARPVDEIRTVAKLLQQGEA